MRTAVDRMAYGNVTDQSRRVANAEGMGGPTHSATVGDQQGQQAWGAALQDSRMARAFGISQQELGEFQHNGVVTDKMAPALGKTLGLDADRSRSLLSGMRVNHHGLSVNPDNGALMLTHGELQSADGSRSVGNGMVTESKTLNGVQLLDKADELDKSGQTTAATGLRGMVGRGVHSSDGGHHGAAPKGQGLGSNESAVYSERTSFDGKMATVGVEHGADTRWFDTSSHREGTTLQQGDNVRIGSDINRGDHESKGSTYNESQGDKYDSQTAWQQALKADPLLFERITEPGITPQERTNRMHAVAAAISDGMRSAGISRSGQSRDSSRAEVSGGVGIPGTRIGGSTGAAYESSDAYDVNLGTQKHLEALESAWSKVGPNMDRSQATTAIAQAGQQSAQQEDAYFKEHGSSSYGATAIPGRGVDAIKKSIGYREMKDIDPSEMKTDASEMPD
jgi:hypothetical protein